MTSRKFSYDYREFDGVARRMAKTHAVLKRWHAGRGEDTAFIGLAVRLPQSEVARIIAADQDRRYAARRRRAATA